MAIVGEPHEQAALGQCRKLRALDVSSSTSVRGRTDSCRNRAQARARCAQGFLGRPGTAARPGRGIRARARQGPRWRRRTVESVTIAPPSVARRAASRSRSGSPTRAMTGLWQRSWIGVRPAEWPVAGWGRPRAMVHVQHLPRPRGRPPATRSRSRRRGQTRGRWHRRLRARRPDDITCGHAGHVDRHALPGPGDFDGLSMDLKCADPSTDRLGVDHELVATGDVPRAERPGEHGAGPGDREHPVDVHDRWTGCGRPADERAVRRSSAFSTSARRCSLSGAAETTVACGSSVRRPRSRTAGSARSVFVITTTPALIPSARRIRACSRVCGIAPSVAAITIRKQSIPVAPATIVWMKRSWPGTSISDIRRPEGSSSCA